MPSRRRWRAGGLRPQALSPAPGSAPLVPEVLPPVRGFDAAAARAAPFSKPRVPDGCVRLAGCPHPLRMERVDAVLPAGPTLLELVHQACDTLRVPSALRGFGYAWVDGAPVPFERWAALRPAPGALVAVRVLAGRPGGGGGGGGSDVTRTLMTVAVMAAAMYFAPMAASYMMYGTTAWASVATATTTGALLTAASGAVIAGVGMYAVNALVPVSQAGAKSSASRLSASPAEDPVYSVSGMSNQLDPWGPIPLALGFVRWAPKHGARPYTEAAGADQHVRALLDWGLGPLLIEDMQIGDTALSDFAAEDGGVIEVQTVRGFPATDPSQDIFSQDIYEEQLSILLEADLAQIRTTGADADECSVDISAQPLADWSGGSKAVRTVNFILEYRLHGSAGAWTNPDGLAGLTVGLPGTDIGVSWYGVACVNFDRAAVRMFWGGKSVPEVPEGWLPVAWTRSWNDATYTPFGEITSIPAKQGWTGLDPSISGNNTLVITNGQRSAGLTLSGATTQAIRTSRRVVFPARGRYDVRLTRTTAESASDSVYDDCYWSALRTITRQAPISVAWTNATTQLRVKATGRLAGTLDKVNGLARTWCLDWDASAGAWVEGATNNCASLYRWVLQCDFNPFPRTDAQIDLDALAEWHEFCEANGFTYNKVVNRSSQEKVRAVLSEIASAGRAIEVMVDGRWSVVVDRDRSGEMPVDFTAAMVWGVTVRRDFREAPHALRCPFINEDTWEEDELIVYAPGYSAANATIYEVYDQPGVTSADARAIHALYRLADMHLRRETFVFSTDFASMAIQGRGSLATLAHWTVGTGLANGRVKSVASNAGALYVTVDEPCLMSDGNAYRVLFRDVDAGTRGVRQVTTNPGLQTVLEIPAEAGGVVPAKGDLFAFGLEGLETRTLIVSGIVPGSAMSAQITAKDYVWPAIQEFLDGGTSEWTAQVTRSPWVARTAPAVPAIRALVSDETVMLRDATGALAPRIAVDYAVSSGLVATAYVQAQIREAGGTWSPSVSVDAGETLLLAGVETGQAYALRLRAVGASGVASAWTAEVEHTVSGGQAKPPGVSSLYRQGNFAVWTDPYAPIDAGLYSVRVLAGKTRNWEKGADWPSEGAIIKDRKLDLTDIGSGVQTIMVKARDVYGNLSEETAFLTLGLGEYAPDNLIATADEHAAGFVSGTITNGSVDGEGNLVADDTGDAYLPEGSSLYLPVALASYLPVAYDAMSYEWTFVPEATDVPGKAYLDSEVSGDGWSIQYRRRGSQEDYLGNDDELYLPDGAALYLGGPTDWAPFPGSIDMGREAVDFKVSTDAGSRQGTVAALSVNVDVEDITESFDDLVISSAGTRVPITRAYREIDYIGGVSLQDDGYGATGFLIKDKDPELGPLLAAIGASQATIDIHNMKGH